MDMSGSVWVTVHQFEQLPGCVIEGDRIRCRLEADQAVLSSLIRLEPSTAVIFWLLWRLRVVESIRRLHERKRAKRSAPSCASEKAES